MQLVSGDCAGNTKAGVTIRWPLFLFEHRMCALLE
jgi:hypothetical protein